MMPRPTRMILSVLSFAIGLGLLAASSADAAKARKHKKVIAAPSSYAISGQPADAGNVVYVGNLYMGTDPDVNIRAFLRKDLSGRWGGSY